MNTSILLGTQKSSRGTISRAPFDIAVATSTAPYLEFWHNDGTSDVFTKLPDYTGTVLSAPLVSLDYDPNGNQIAGVTASTTNFLVVFQRDATSGLYSRVETVAATSGIGTPKVVKYNTRNVNREVDIGGSNGYIDVVSFTGATFTNMGVANMGIGNFEDMSFNADGTRMPSVGLSSLWIYTRDTTATTASAWNYLRAGQTPTVPTTPNLTGVATRPDSQGFVMVGDSPNQTVTFCQRSLAGDVYTSIWPAVRPTIQPYKVAFGGMGKIVAIVGKAVGQPIIAYYTTDKASYIPIPTTSLPITTGNSTPQIVVSPDDAFVIYTGDSDGKVYVAKNNGYEDLTSVTSSLNSLTGIRAFAISKKL